MKWNVHSIQVWMLLQIVIVLCSIKAYGEKEDQICFDHLIPRMFNEWLNIKSFNHFDLKFTTKRWNMDFILHVRNASITSLKGYCRSWWIDKYKQHFLPAGSSMIDQTITFNNHLMLLNGKWFFHKSSDNSRFIQICFLQTNQIFPI